MKEKEKVMLAKSDTTEGHTASQETEDRKIKVIKTYDKTPEAVLSRGPDCSVSSVEDQSEDQIITEQFGMNRLVF